MDKAFHVSSVGSHVARRRAVPWVRCVLAAALVMACAAVQGAPILAAAPESSSVARPPDEPASDPQEARSALVAALTRANAAVVGVKVESVDDAPSARSLGKTREGSGVVIGDDGLILTIGYLILEADSVDVVIDGERDVPARVVAYDQATGFGLVQPLVPIKVAPAPLGEASALAEAEAVMISSGGTDGAVSIGRLVSRRDFSGYWEYHIDNALFTAPPRTDHSGAALFNSQGQLIGIGSLVVTDAMGPGHARMPGNMFVPVDLLKPILAEMRSSGASSQSHRAWLGVNCVEQRGEVRVLRVNDDSPAMQAGLQTGDRILRIDGAAVKDLAGFYKTLWMGSTPDREVTLDIARGGEPQTVKVKAQDRMKTFRHAQGI